MAWQKKYDHKKPYKKVICIDDRNVKLLRLRYFNNVIDETDTTYLIQFNSGAANWYSKSRFIDPPKPKQVKTPEIDDLIKQLF